MLQNSTDTIGQAMAFCSCCYCEKLHVPYAVYAVCTGIVDSGWCIFMCTDEKKCIEQRAENVSTHAFSCHLSRTNKCITFFYFEFISLYVCVSDDDDDDEMPNNYNTVMYNCMTQLY